MAIHPIQIDVKNFLTPFKDFEDILYDHFGPKHEAQYFWRYSAQLYFEITNYISFISALTFSAENRIYVLLKDFNEPWRDNGTFMKVIDYLETKAANRERADPYDVRIVQPDETDSEKLDEDLFRRSEFIVDKRSDADVIAYASRNLPPKYFYTSDFEAQALLINALKRGCSKDKRRLERPAEVVIERAGMKSKKKASKAKVTDDKKKK